MTDHDWHRQSGQISQHLHDTLMPLRTLLATLFLLWFSGILMSVRDLPSSSAHRWHRRRADETNKSGHKRSTSFWHALLPVSAATRAPVTSDFSIHLVNSVPLTVAKSSDRVVVSLNNGGLTSMATRPSSKDIVNGAAASAPIVAEPAATTLPLAPSVSNTLFLVKHTPAHGWA